MLFGLYYCTEFIQYAPKSSPTLPGSVKTHIQGCGAIAITVTFLYLSGLSFATELIGKAAVVLCLAMFGSPLAALRVVVQTRSAKAIPLPFTLASLVNCFLWTIYGVFELGDINVYLPNILGLSFSVVQLALKFAYASDPMSRDSSLPL